MQDEIIADEEPNDFFISCPVTSEDIVHVINGSKVPVKSCGQCADCGNWFSLDGLHQQLETIEYWPVVYIGLSCKECWNKDDDTESH